MWAPDVIFHMAGLASVTGARENPAAYFRANVEGTVNMVEAARQCGARLVLASTGGVMYGECQVPAPETRPAAPSDPYGCSKRCAEQYVNMANRQGSDHVVLRYSNVYGPGCHGVVAEFERALDAGEPAPVYGDGEQTRDFLHVDDAVRATVAAAKLMPTTYNVGTGQPTSVNALAEAMGVETHPCPDLGEVRKSCLDVRRLARVMEWHPDPISERLPSKTL
jgi:UDP-glucose 4-epimerase